MYSLPLLLVGSLCAYLFGHMSTVIPAGGPVPYVFVSMFIFPIAVIWPLLKDLTELQELGTITQTERSRLRSLINDAQRYLKTSAYLLLFFGVTTGTMLYLVVIQQLEARLALSCIGFFIGCSVCIFAFLVNIRLRVQNYKSTVASRAEELKQSKRLIKRLSNSKE
ncbi:hypothetical protein SAMN02745132_03477 [Enterovibrio nigricans DSM 22720]|uniref:Uncharacterized protein n=1 Tax=Enterovibrio nigricans DSM 22720 TaxID=1121868 RepID=A0A1T4V930_9GAMM|nr:hypothetical protein SAMN02745132_03477 [Enterovibrio nigricans DSM 22720]